MRGASSAIHRAGHAEDRSLRGIDLSRAKAKGQHYLAKYGLLEPGDVAATQNCPVEVVDIKGNPARIAEPIPGTEGRVLRRAKPGKPESAKPPTRYVIEEKG